MAPFAFHPGDITACYGSDGASRVISLATSSLLGPDGLRWSPSHVALCCGYQGGVVWIESTTLCSHPCLVQQRVVSGVQVHDPADRISDYLGEGGQVRVFRLRELHAFDPDEDELVTRLLVGQFVRQQVTYDLRGALLSGTRVFQWTRLFPRADLESLFCSELIAAVLMRLGRMNHANPSRYNPGRLLRELVRTGVYYPVHLFRGGTSWGG